MKELKMQLTKFEAEAKYSSIKSDNSNLDKVYNHNLKVWYFRKSDRRDPVNEEIEPINFISKDPDSLNCSRSVNGIPLSESMFIEEELKLLSKLDRDAFLLDEKARYDTYINFIKSKISPIKPVQTLHSNIFKGNAFNVWQSMFRDFDISKSSRTDVKFMFEIMKKDGLIYEIIREVDFLKWVNEVYELTIEKTSYADLKNQKRLAIYNNAKELNRN